VPLESGGWLRAGVVRCPFAGPTPRAWETIPMVWGKLTCRSSFFFQ